MQAEGYADGDTTLYHRFTLMDFLKASNPVDFLSKANEVSARKGDFGSTRDRSPQAQSGEGGQPGAPAAALALFLQEGSGTKAETWD